MTTLTTIVRSLRPQFGKPGLSTKRAIDEREVLAALRASSAAKSRVRVYSFAGFVPNKYAWRCQIQYVEGEIVDGKWVWRTGWTGAQRAGGRAKLIVVQ